MTFSAEQFEQAANVVRSRWPRTARAGLILGTGLDNLASHIVPDVVIPYDEIPNFPRSTALGHRGQLVCGSLIGVPVIAMQGRCHFYEGYSLHQVTLGVQLMAERGAKLLIASNAAGGLNSKFKTGDIMAIEDHLDLMFRSQAEPSLSHEIERPARKASSPYDTGLVARALEIAREENFAAHRGVYVAVTGPNYETRAEYRFLRNIGGDVVGMSTVPEALVAARCGMRVLALSIVTNVATPDAPHKVEATEVVNTAEHAEPNLRKIVLGVLLDEVGKMSK